MLLQKLVVPAAAWLLSAHLSAAPAMFEVDAPDVRADPIESFERQGFKVVFRDRDGKPITKAAFEARGKDQPVAMRVDGEAKTVEITLDGEVPAELKVPLKISPGSLLPRLSLRGLDGAVHAWPRSDGKHTLLDFYFAACGPCIQEVPALNAFKRTRPDVAVLAITFDDVEESRRFVARRGLAWDVVPDARAFIDALGVTVYPTVMLVDPQGRLVAVRDAAAGQEKGAEETLAAWVDRVLP